jgi:hypothetical protein
VERDPASSVVHLKGWLMKQKHGKFKLFQKRYFVLFDDELRYYKTQVDISLFYILYMS